MSVNKQILSSGDGATKAKQGDTVTIEYTGWLYDASAPETKGKQFDSSVGRGDFRTEIGVGKVIKGWDVGILNAEGGMTLGEKARLTISSGFPGHIPKNAALVFDVQLKKIN